MAYYSILDPFLRPLLILNPLLAVIIISFIISIVMLFVYKKLTDQSLLKRLKDEIKELQAEMKTLKDKPEKMMKVQKRMMETNSKYMMKSLKPNLFTIIPIIFIFGWLNANMAFYPLIANTQFSITAQFEEGTTGNIELIPPDGITVITALDQEILNDKAEWVLQGDAGTYTVEYKYNDDEFNHKLIVVDNFKDRRYAKPVLRAKDLGIKSDLKSITISNKRVIPFAKIPLIRDIPWVGNWGWLGTYILFSITFSIILRKRLKVY